MTEVELIELTNNLPKKDGAVSYEDILLALNMKEMFKEDRCRNQISVSSAERK